MFTISKIKVEEFLKYHKGKYHATKVNWDIWVMLDNTVVRLPKGHQRIDIEIFKMIGEQIGASVWDIDMYL